LAVVVSRSFYGSSEPGTTHHDRINPVAVSRVLSVPSRFPRVARDGHSSGTRLAARLSRPTRATRRERLRGHGTKWVFVPCRRSPLFGLAPGGVYPAAPVARGAVRSCRTVSPLPADFPVNLGRSTLGARAVCFLWHCPWGRPRRRLAGTVFPWSPDFPLSAGLARQTEESPGSTGIRCRPTAGGGDPRDSATENKPPAHPGLTCQGLPESPRARVKRCGKSAPRPWQQGRQGKPHREQDRIGATGGMGRRPTSSHGRGGVPASSPGLVARGAPQGASQRNGRLVPPGETWMARTEPGLQRRD